GSLNDESEKLLFREPHDIIQNDYEKMQEHPKTGPAFTYMLRAIGGPSVPDAHSLAELHPLQAHIPVSPNPVHSPEVVVDTPLPDGNLANFNTRWSMIEE